MWKNCVLAIPVWLNFFGNLVSEIFPLFFGTTSAMVYRSSGKKCRNICLLLQRGGSTVFDDKKKLF